MSFIGHDLLFPTIVAKFDRKDLLEDVVELFNSLGENDWSDDIQTLDVQILNRNQKLVDEFTKDVKKYIHEELSFGHDLQMIRFGPERRKVWFCKAERQLEFVREKRTHA